MYAYSIDLQKKIVERPLINQMNVQKWNFAFEHSVLAGRIFNLKLGI